LKASSEPGKLWKSPPVAIPSKAIHAKPKNVLQPSNTNTMIFKQCQDIMESNQETSTSKLSSQQKWHVGSTSTATSSSSTPKNRTEEERRSLNYDSLVRAQRRYAEKITTPSGPEYRFTKQQWESLGEELGIKDWDAGFLNDMPIKTLRKENVKGKGRELAVEGSDEEEDCITFMMEV